MKQIMKKIKSFFSMIVTIEQEKSGLFIPNRQVSWLMLILFIFGIFCFLAGYFLGHKRAIDRFVAKLEEESFADRINYALYTMNDRDSSEFEQDQDENNGSEDSQEETVNQENESETFEQGPETEVVVTEQQSLFFAPLAGFGTLQKAEAFAKQVKIIDPKVTIETKISRNAKGRTITWFQAITGEFTTREELEQVLARLRKEAHIKNEIKIVEKTKEKRKG